MAVIEMSVKDWIEVKDNPRQRDTEKRANYAKSNHLSKYEQPHSFVWAAVKDGQIVCKLDGHTRALLWKSGELETPPNGKVTVLLIEIKSRSDAKYYYDLLDAPRAAKKPSDFLFGATRENNFKLRSALLRSCSFSTQLKLADGNGKKFDGQIYPIVTRWKGILQELDALGLSSSYGVLICCMLGTIKRDGIDCAGKFWQALDSNMGTKTAEGMDGVEALTQHMMIRRGEGRMAGYDNLIDILQRAITAYEAYKSGKRLKNLRVSDLSVLFPRTQKQKTGE